MNRTEPTNHVTDLRRVLGGSADAPVLAIERWYPTSAGDLWKAVTDPERLSRWLGRFLGPVPKAEGDDFRIDLGPGDDDPPYFVASGTLVGCSAERHLAAFWNLPNEPTGFVDMWLTPNGTGTTLLLQHRLDSHDDLVDYGGTWETRLTCLIGLFDARVGTPDGRFLERQGRDAWTRLAELQHGADRRIRVSRVVPAPVGSVWDAFTTRDGLASWWWATLGATHDLDPHPGGRYRFAVPAAGFAVRGTVLVMDRLHHLAWSWIWEDGDTDGPAERVDITFAATDGGTRVDVDHQGPWTDADQAADYRVGWESTLDALVGR